MAVASFIDPLVLQCCLGRGSDLVELVLIESGSHFQRRLQRLVLLEGRARLADALGRDSRGAQLRSSLDHTERNHPPAIISAVPQTPDLRLRVAAVPGQLAGAVDELL